MPYKVEAVVIRQTTFGCQGAAGNEINVVSDDFKGMEKNAREEAVVEAIKDKISLLGQHGILTFTKEQWAKQKVDLEKRKLNQVLATIYDEVG